MSDTQRLLQAAGALSQALRAHSIPHAFHGNVLIAVLANVPQSDVCLVALKIAASSLNCFQEIFCIVQGGPHHPFRYVREAVAGSEHFVISNSPWTNR